MSADDTGGRSAGKQNTEGDVPVPDDEAIADAHQKSAEIDARYEPGARETVVLPGTGGTVSGTAFADYVDDDGNLRDPEERESS
ncbi:MAG: hypothetical protein WAW17_14310 [Rhodococcus sp. (in: high G+C Gram-positive bacteria)]|uniref:hypothetical protein n=1 Tax=Rhodococcus sp. TaxID=1831 RepID=UPI003BB21427